MLSAPSISGKSSFSIRFLHHLETLCTERTFDCGFIWSYSVVSDVPPRHLGWTKNVRFKMGVPAYFNNTQGRPCLVILNDLVIDVFSKDVFDLFTKGSHHSYISVILITQNLFQQGRFCRDICAKLKQYIVIEKLRD